MYAEGGHKKGRPLHTCVDVSSGCAKGSFPSLSTIESRKRLKARPEMLLCNNTDAHLHSKVKHHELVVQGGYDNINFI